MADGKKSVIDIIDLISKARRQAGIKKRVGSNTDTEVPIYDSVLTEFNTEDDWMLTVILVATMHINPDLDSEEAVRLARNWVLKLRSQKSESVWKNYADRISRFGIRSQASKIRRELYKLI